MYQSIYGLLMGTALGDSMGLPFEGLSRAKIAKKRATLKGQHLLWGRGLFSDDTEHTMIITQALIESFDDERGFQRGVSRRLQWWLLGFPAGVGFATMRAIIRSFFLKEPAVFSAGNAPAMRSGILGVIFGENDTKLKAMVKAHTMLTHSDPKAYYGALAVAKACYCSMHGLEGSYFRLMRELVDDEEFLALLKEVEDHRGVRSVDFAKHLELERGVGGYIYHTLPMVLHIWLRHGDNFEVAIKKMIACGGDSDTTSAILGAIVGAKGGVLPQQWIDGVVDYPLSITSIEQHAMRLSQVVESRQGQKAPRLLYPLMLLRNMLFLMVVLMVAIKRIF
jgi:ADP-ribosyl-[dinitrogen reductase] hydrolase